MMSGGREFTVEISGISDISAAEMVRYILKRGSSYGGGDVTVKLNNIRNYRK